MRRSWMFSLVLILVVLLAGCLPGTPQANMANPASVFCEQNGGKLEIMQTEAGAVGVCMFPDGSSCEEWSFMRGECKPGQSIITPVATALATMQPAVTPAASATPELALDGCQIYYNEEAGYSLHYPADAHITNNEDPAHGITIEGPLKDGETWPVIGISHPGERADLRLPEGADLAQWLADHNLVGENRQPDGQIAGANAIHYRHNRSPQSYAFDQYIFAHAGHIYTLTINHTGDREDWDLYQHILESFQFIS